MSLIRSSRCLPLEWMVFRCLHHLRLILVVAPAQHVGEAEDGVHRRADLVAHVGQEVALGAVGLLGVFLRAWRSSTSFSCSSVTSSKLISTPCGLLAAALHRRAVDQERAHFRRAVLQPHEAVAQRRAVAQRGAPGTVHRPPSRASSASGPGEGGRLLADQSLRRSRPPPARRPGWPARCSPWDRPPAAPRPSCRALRARVPGWRATDRAGAARGRGRSRTPPCSTNTTKATICSRGSRT